MSNHVSNRIKELRIEKGFTQTELAEGIITRSYLSQIERGSIEPSYEVLMKLSEKLGVDVSELNKRPLNKNLIHVQIKKDIKYAENSVQEAKIDRAEKIIENATLNVMSEDIDTNERGVLLWVKGRIAEGKGEYKKAIDYFNESVSYLENGTLHEKTVRSLTSLGDMYSILDQKEKALEVLNKAYRLAIHEHIGGTTRVSLLLVLGVLHGKLNELYSAINFLTQALELNISLDSFYKFGQIHMALGICYMQLENYALSMKSFEQAKEFFSLKEDEVNQAGVYNNLGILYRKEGDYDTAIQFFKESIFMYNNLNNSNQRNNVEIELAKTYFEKGGLEEARRVCLDVLELASINKYKYEAYIILGDIETEKNNFSLAIEYYKNALAELGPNQENVYKKLLEKQAKVYHKLGDYERASSLLLDAVS